MKEFAFGVIGASAAVAALNLAPFDPDALRLGMSLCLFVGMYAAWVNEGVPGVGFPGAAGGAVLGAVGAGLLMWVMGRGESPWALATYGLLLILFPVAMGDAIGSLTWRLRRRLLSS